jgi:hypothetical protein
MLSHWHLVRLIRPEEVDGMSVRNSGNFQRTTWHYIPGDSTFGDTAVRTSDLLMQLRESGMSIWCIPKNSSTTTVSTGKSTESLGVLY